MPKEIVVDQITKGFRVETSWGRHETCIQVATVATDALDRTVIMLNDLLTDCGMPTVDADQLKTRAKKSIQATLFTGWHVTITERRQINELIRQLRRARDHAFGRDE